VCYQPSRREDMVQAHNRSVCCISLPGISSILLMLFMALIDFILTVESILRGCFSVLTCSKRLPRPQMMQPESITMRHLKRTGVMKESLQR
jgi:hypothetical protein